jgi:ABC-2 type transport system permease protein
MNLLYLLRHEVRHLWRTRRLLTAVVVLAVFGLLSPVLARYMREFMSMLPEGEQIAALIPESTAADAVSQYLKNTGQFGVLLAVLLAMGSVAREKERGTAALVLVKPVRRAEFICAKFAAIGLALTVAVAWGALACYYYTLVLFGRLDLGDWVASNALVSLFLLVHAALTLLFSTVARSQALAGGLSFGLAITLAAAGSLPTVGEYLPGQLLTWAGELALGAESAAWPALVVSAALAAAAVGAAVAIFNRQEL